MKKFNSFAEICKFYKSGGIEIFAKRGRDFEILEIDQIISGSAFLAGSGNTNHSFSDTEYYHN